MVKLKIAWYTFCREMYASFSIGTSWLTKAFAKMSLYLLDMSTAYSDDVEMIRKGDK